MRGERRCEIGDEYEQAYVYDERGYTWGGNGYTKCIYSRPRGILHIDSAFHELDSSGEHMFAEEGWNIPEWARGTGDKAFGLALFAHV